MKKIATKYGIFTFLCVFQCSSPDPVKILDHCDHTQIMVELDKILPKNPIIIDCGAYNGNETKMMADQWKSGTVYSFEAVHENFLRLRKNTQECSNVLCFNVALSDAIGEAVFYVSSDRLSPETPSASSSLLKPKDHLIYSEIIFPRQITVPTITLDEWALRNNVDHVDLLWLDMQGFELNMMKASPNIMRTVKAVYTEIEFVEAYEGQYLYKDIKQWLEAEGFVEVACDANPTEHWFGNSLFVRP